MQDATPGKDNPLKSPGELHAELVKLYGFLPQKTIGSEKKGESSEIKSRELIEQDRLRSDKEAKAISKKFKEIIAQSPTTNFYKTMVPLLFDHVMWVGKEAEDEVELSMALQIDTEVYSPNRPGGIFTKEGAAAGEAWLFSTVCKDFGEALGMDLSLGEDPVSPELQYSGSFGFRHGLTTRRFVDFVLNWRKQYQENYGKAPEA